MDSSDRRRQINNYIQANGKASIQELSKLFPHVSDMTLRRDLSFLESKGEIVRIRGGARSIDSLTETCENLYSYRALENTEGKMAISKKALQYLEVGRSIYMDSGTTMMCLARIMPDQNFSILTSGPNIGMEIIKKSKPSVTLVGGHLSRNTLSTSSIYSLEFIKDINIDIAFMATSGFTLESGFTSGNFNECELKKLVIQKARKVIMMMDIGKINKSMPFTFANLKDIDILICDTELPKDIYEAVVCESVTIL